MLVKKITCWNIKRRIPKNGNRSLYQKEPDIKDLNAIIQKQTGDVVTIAPNTNTLKSIMTVKPGCKVSFKARNTLANLLGFQPRIYFSGTHESENIVNILSVKNILVHLNIIAGSIVNGQKHPLIYSFFPEVIPDIKLLRNQHTPSIFLFHHLER
jgi:hypothetical protein